MAALIYYNIVIAVAVYVCSTASCLRLAMTIFELIELFNYCLPFFT